MIAVKIAQNQLKPPNAEMTALSLLFLPLKLVSVMTIAPLQQRRLQSVPTTAPHLPIKLLLLLKELGNATTIAPLRLMNPQIALMTTAARYQPENQRSAPIAENYLLMNLLVKTDPANPKSTQLQLSALTTANRSSLNLVKMKTQAQLSSRSLSAAETHAMTRLLNLETFQDLERQDSTKILHVMKNVEHVMKFVS